MTSAQASAALPEHVGTSSRAGSVAAALVAPATIVVILAVSLLMLMAPVWMHFALDLSHGPGSRAGMFQISDRTVWELFVGPGTFSEFAADEAAHMRDVRVVFWGFIGLAIAGAALISWRIVRHGHQARTWRSISRGGLALVIALPVLGVFAFLAFDVAFELFHRILFPGGNFSFPADSLLIQLYPYAFWQLSAGALGVLGIVGGLVVWWLARRRARSLENVRSAEKA
jgi:hypothetical protein